MNDIRPPRRPYPSASSNTPPQNQAQATPPQLTSLPQRLDVLPKPVAASEESPVTSRPPRKKRSRIKVIIISSIVTIFVALAVGAGAAYLWYQGQIRPVAPDDKQHVRIVITSGMRTDAIARLLKQHQLIHSTEGFDWYVRISGSAGQLQAGSYSLSRSMALADIVNHLKNGKPDSFSITFLPGATVAANKKVLLKAGYSQAEVDAAFAKQYEHPLFATKPASADLEGYIYGETYQFTTSATVEDILTMTFDQMYKVVQSNNLVAAYKKQGLTLYEGITLASIIQRESGGDDDKAQIAQVFLLRLDQGMSLGSDVTYQYIADKLGVPRDVNLDNPYNTRRHAGLPPGPIAAPGLGALQSVAAPASGEYLFFISGDDHVTYFARTQAEHDANIANHCHEKCQII